ncbi:hypothetical protein [Nocardia abscessus]|uniref:hypothetical protein n=1 Tax=Nocardia abscessus TaxID=120957 RepID=UPI002458E036|nr:hypothetical protein [Nocardia abscessus]
MTHELIAALESLTRAAAQWRQEYEDGHHNGGHSPDVEIAFIRAYAAGATRDQAEEAYQLGVDWGVVAA